MLDINSIDIDEETRQSIIDLYYNEYKTTIRISKMLYVPLPAVKAIVRHHNRVLKLGTTPDAVVTTKPNTVESKTPIPQKLKQIDEDSLPDELADLLEKMRERDKIKCPILQYV